MNIKRKISLSALLLIVIITLYFIFPYLQNRTNPDLVPTFNADPINFTNEEELHFFPEGFIVCGDLGSPSRFYDWDGSDLLPPFKQDDLSAEGGTIDIIARTENHIATSSNRIYNTQTVPFNLIYENKDIYIWDMKEMGDQLMLLIQDGDELAVKPFLLVQNSDFLISLDGTGDSKYISADSSASGKELSLLTMSIDAPVPFSRVFKYVNRNELYGVLSLEDQLIYNIYRLKSNIVLIGINDILCYNIDGKLLWSVDNNSNGLFHAIPKSNNLLLYFPELRRIGETNGNAILIKDNGNYSIEQYPKYLTLMQPYKDGYIGVEYRNTIVFVRKNGKVIKKQRLTDPINELVVNPFNPDSIYVRTDDNTLQHYTTDIQEENQ